MHIACNPKKGGRSFRNFGHHGITSVLKGARDGGKRVSKSLYKSASCVKGGGEGGGGGGTRVQHKCHITLDFFNIREVLRVGHQNVLQRLAADGQFWKGERSENTVRAIRHLLEKRVALHGRYSPCSQLKAQHFFRRRHPS
jgi:hypothetical protein